MRGKDLARWNELNPKHPCYAGNIGVQEEAHYHKTLDDFCEIVKKSREEFDKTGETELFLDLLDRLGVADFYYLVKHTGEG